MRNRVYNILVFVLLCFTFLVNSALANEVDSVVKCLSQARKKVYTYPDEAVQLLDSLQIHATLTDLQQIELLKLKASANAAQYNSYRAIEYAKEALRLAEKINSTEWQVINLAFIGNQYYIINVKDEVINYLNRAESIISNKELNDSMRYINGNIYFLKAINFKENLDGDIAIKYFKKAIHVYEQVDSRSTSRNIGISLIQMGYIYNEQKQLDSANVCYDKALSLVKDQSLQDIYLYAQLGKSNVLSSQKKFREAIAKLNFLFDSLGLPSDPALLSELYEALADNYLAVNDITHYTLNSNKRDSVLNHMILQEQLVIDNLIAGNIKSNKVEVERYMKRHNVIVFTLGIVVLVLVIKLVFVFKKYIGN
ncbi:tetratricopeptide repeat protein [Carboxylicivirga linearis]|uniref:Tetratricopeptide repeat protein n=1 Tax=Carboxylicivirga linearis TaxID=1628157 RepID=A0ABS5K180_9BACT|nr:hypothetical protein [Carboxylicivirga linearis]MBS2100888.1 hypothetical protein [Carboxylicivirga linearis]